MEDPKNIHNSSRLPKHTEESKLLEASKVIEIEKLNNAELEKEHGFKEGLADNSNNQPPGTQQK